MKVKELIKELQMCSPEEEISIIVPVGCCGDTETIDITEVENIFGNVFIYTEKFPLFPSCISAGNATRIDKRKE